MLRPVPRPRHKRRVPKQRQRNAFSSKVRKQIMQDSDGACRSCGRRATQIHHVMPRGRGGRGVYSNGMAVCNDCHTKIHRNNDVLEYWIEVFRKKHGDNFYKDRWD